MKVIHLEGPDERSYAVQLWYALQAEADSVPGWMVDETKLQEVIDRIERAINHYDRIHQEVNH